MNPRLGTMIKCQDPVVWTFRQIEMFPRITSKRLYNKTNFSWQDIERALFILRDEGKIQCINKQWHVRN